MTVLRLYRIAIFLLCMLPVLLIHTAAHAFSVDEIRFGAHPDKTRLVFDLSEPRDFRTFTLADPYRLVLDLPDFTWRVGALPHNPNAGITAVRHGNLEAGISRIVFDLNRPITIQSAFIIPKQDGKPDRLVIDIASASGAEFSQNAGKTFGTLSLGQGNLAAQIPQSPPPSQSGNLLNNSAYSATRISPPNQPPPEAAPPQPATKPSIVLNKKPLVVIDPGHGGVDPGTVGANGQYEKHVVLALSQALKEELEGTGRYRVLMTRDNDIFIKLGDRVKFARDHGADLFISVHADSMPKPGVSGASFYTLSDKSSDEHTAKLAARENKADLIAGIDLSVEDEDVANILVNLAMRDTMNQSKYFANTLVDTFHTDGLKLLDRTHRYAGFAVLKAPDVPSVLIEAGFMSNKEEANRLSTPAHRKLFARSVRGGIDAYFRTVAENDRS